MADWKLLVRMETDGSLLLSGGVLRPPRSPPAAAAATDMSSDRLSGYRTLAVVELDDDHLSVGITDFRRAGVVDFILEFLQDAFGVFPFSRPPQV